MIKILLALLLIPSIAFGAPDTIGGVAVGDIDTLGGVPIEDIDTFSGVEVSACNTSSAIFWWRAEAFDFSGTNGTLDYALFVGGDVGTNISTAAINSAAAKIGTNGLDIPTGDDSVQFDVPADLDDEGHFAAWVRFVDYEAEDDIFRLYAVSGTNVMTIRMYGTDELKVTWDDGGTGRDDLITTDANISLNTWYFIEFSWKTSTNHREIKVNGVTPTGGLSSATIGSFASATLYGYFGNTLNGGTPDFHMDNMMLFTDSTVDAYTNCRDLDEWPE